MTLSLDNILLLGSLLLLLGLLGSRTSKYGIPVLLLFIAVGMLAGSDGFGGIYFNNPGSAKFIGAVALSFILFSGGLETRWKDIRPVIWQGLTLSTVGVVLTATVVGVFVAAVTDLSLLEGLLLGSIVSSTDAAAVFSILRSRSVALKGNLRPLLELESGSNDPMAYFLTICFTFLLTHKDVAYTSLIFLFVRQMVLGGMVGAAMGWLMPKIINRIRFDYDGLYSVLLITLMIFTFSFTELIGGNAFLSVYISACVLGNKNFVHKKSLIKHFDGQAWLMQGIMFITLGLLVFPKQLIPFIGIGLLISVVLILVARPLSVYICLLGFGISHRKKIFLSWVGLRGAVPIVLATYPLTAGLEKSNVIFNLVFFISITSVLVQGTTLSALARRLKLTLPAEKRKDSAFEKELTLRGKSIMVQTTIGTSCPCLGKSLVELALGNEITIASFERDGKYFMPDGTTALQKGDRLSVLAENPATVRKFCAILRVETFAPSRDPAAPDGNPVNAVHETDR
ncbi:MAG TPA: potassium/proton antiporter [Bacteroidales bacterium]|nr:potassium/proton antiporter [Bacteroidales bacterium]